MSGLPNEGTVYGINNYRSGGFKHSDFHTIKLPLKTDEGYLNQLLGELTQIFDPETIISPNIKKPFSTGINGYMYAWHFEPTGTILYAPKKRIPTWIYDDATNYVEIKVSEDKVRIKHGQNKNLETLDTILLNTSLFPRLQTYLVETKQAKTKEEAANIIKEKIAPLARESTPLAMT